MSLVMTQEEIIAAIVQLKQNTKDNEKRLNEFYPKLLTHKEEARQTEMRNEALFKEQEQKLKLKITELEDKNHLMQQHLDKCTKELVNYKLNLEDQRNILIALEKCYYKDIRPFIETFNKQKPVLEEYEKQSENRFDDIQKQIDKYFEFEKEIRKLRTIVFRIEQKGNEKEYFKMEYDEIRFKVDVLQKMIETCKEENEEQLNEIRVLNEHKKKTNAKIDTVQMEISNLMDGKCSFDYTHGEMSDKYQQVQKEINVLKQEEAVLNAGMKEFKSKIESNFDDIINQVSCMNNKILIIDDLNEHYGMLLQIPAKLIELEMKVSHYSDEINIQMDACKDNESIIQIQINDIKSQMSGNEIDFASIGDKSIICDILQGISDRFSEIHENINNLKQTSLTKVAFEKLENEFHIMVGNMKDLETKIVQQDMAINIIGPIVL